MYAGLFSAGQPASLATAFHVLVLVVFGAHLLLLFLRMPFIKWAENERGRQIFRLASPAFFAAVLLLTIAWGEGDSPFVYVQF